MHREACCGHLTFARPYKDSPPLDEAVPHRSNQTEGYTNHARTRRLRNRCWVQDEGRAHAINLLDVARGSSEEVLSRYANCKMLAVVQLHVEAAG